MLRKAINVGRPLRLTSKGEGVQQGQASATTMVGNAHVVGMSGKAMCTWTRLKQPKWAMMTSSI